MQDNYPGLECPNCNKWGVIFDEDKPFECPNCHEEYNVDDVCPECERLVKGSCYSCKMD